MMELVFYQQILEKNGKKKKSSNFYGVLISSNLKTTNTRIKI